MWETLLLAILILVAYLMVRRLSRGASTVSVDEFGAYWQEKGASYRLDFVRVNGVQLIAKVRKDSRLVDALWPSYRVIYRDSLPYRHYRVLRSFAAQQIILRRSEAS